MSLVPRSMRNQLYVFDTESLEAYQGIEEQFRSELRAQGPVESMFEDDIVINNWRLIRFRVMEAALVNTAMRNFSMGSFEGSNTLPSAQHTAHAMECVLRGSGILPFLYRAELSSQRSISASLKLLHAMQERRLEKQTQSPEAHPKGSE